VLFTALSIIRINDITTDVVEAYDNIPELEYIKPIPTSIKGKIKYYSERYDVPAHVTSTVVRCESQYNPNAVGDGGNSRGLVQIHKPSHPNISDEEAFDPDFALKFLTKNLAEGKGRMWTCWRNNFT
jgi:soluble lytic murein transglycosylase-like protein